MLQVQCAAPQRTMNQPVCPKLLGLSEFSRCTDQTSVQDVVYDIWLFFFLNWMCPKPQGSSESSSCIDQTSVQVVHGVGSCTIGPISLYHSLKF